MINFFIILILIIMEIIKKPKGRPKKIIEEVIEKKPKGRPKKIIEEVIEKKAKGRPKKIIEEVIEKKPKGRPKKIIEEVIEKKPEGRPKKIIEEVIEKKPEGRPKKIIEKKPEGRSKKIIEDTDNRIKYFERIKKLMKGTNDIRIEGNNIYIGNIKIIKKIGSESKNGLILLGELDNYKIALKITKYNPKKTNELDTFKMVSNAVLNNKTNNFPMLYDYNIYNPLNNIDKFPKIFHKFIKNPFIIYFNEIADGDLKEFLNKNYDNDELIINALYQTLMSLVDFYKITGKFHNDSHSGNFLYHKISLLNKDFEYMNGDDKCKIRNLGYLFVIWDLEKSTDFHKHKYRINSDIEKLLMEFFNENDIIKGFMSSNKPYGKKVKLIVMDLYKNLILNNKASFYEMGYSPEKLKELITIIFRKII
jgi:hypothetical protein